MSTHVSLKALVNKLKKQVKTLEKQEMASRKQMQDAIKKMRKAGEGYKDELASKVRIISDKMTHAHLSSYHKAAKKIEKQLMKIAQEKINAVALALAKIERKHATLLTKRFAKAKKKVKKTKVTTKAK